MAKEPGLSLLDIAPQSEQVAVGGSMVNVFGVSAEGVFKLFARFPEMQQWFKGGKPDLNKMVTESPEAIAAIIAAGCGTPGNEAAEEVASKLPVDTQLDFLEAIGRLTFKSGFGPFVNRIVALAALAASENYGRVQGMKLPPQSSHSLRPATHPEPSGNTPPAK